MTRVRVRVVAAQDDDVRLLARRERAGAILEAADARALDRRELEHLAAREELRLLLVPGRERGLVREQPVRGEQEAHLREHVARARS